MTCAGDAEPGAAEKRVMQRTAALPAQLLSGGGCARFPRDLCRHVCRYQATFLKHPRLRENVASSLEFLEREEKREGARETSVGRSQRHNLATFTLSCGCPQA